MSTSTGSHPFSNDFTDWGNRQARMVRQDEADARRARFLEVEFSSSPKAVGEGDRELDDLCGSVAERDEAEIRAAVDAELDQEGVVWGQAWGRALEASGGDKHAAYRAAQTALTEFQIERDRAARTTIQLPSLAELEGAKNTLVGG